MYFSFIFPVCNEQECLEKQLCFFYKELIFNKIKCREILLVENGSSDRTGEIINNIIKSNKLIKGLKLRRASYGRAVRKGLLLAKAEYIFLLNVDFFDFNFIRGAIKNLGKYDVVVGSKMMSMSKDNRSLIRKLKTRVLYLIMKYVFKYQGTDTHGIKVFRNDNTLKQTIKECFCREDMFDTELLLRLSKKGGKILELPVEIEEIRKSRYKKFWIINRILGDVGRVMAGVIVSKLK